MNGNLNKSYPNLTQAFADPNLQPGHTLLVVGTITEPAPVIIPPGWFGTIIGSPAWPGTIQQSAPGTCDPTWGGGVNCMIDARQRGGHVRISGLRFRVPNGATAIQAIGWPNPTPQPLTIERCRFQGATPTAVFSGIVVGVNGGPGVTFRIERNIISGRIGDAAIAIVGNNTNANVQIRWNQITITDASAPNLLGVGIGLTGLTAGGNIVVERNRIDGGGSTADALAGIALAPFVTIPTTSGAPGAIVRRNTILNFSDTNVTSTPFPPLRGTGIALDSSPGARIEANVIRDNADGVAVDPLTASSSAGPPAASVNDNNITCTNVPGCIAAGSRGLVFNGPTYNLNAENNWWGTSTGPGGGTGCTGTGLPVLPACGTAAGQVDVAPFRSSANPNAGA
ncbi:MAG: right-handed parallel beta-helix repeat-containing protein [Blastocatellia bacterium]|nr:right-handed parallel beta-helix repeat-containing protein [Blastocatellia bacterium]